MLGDHEHTMVLVKVWSESFPMQWIGRARCLISAITPLGTPAVRQVALTVHQYTHLLLSGNRL